MSNDSQKADQIAFHFYTKLFYAVNDARATDGARAQSKLDKWFNLETPDSDLFTREAREPYRSISSAPPPGPPPMEIQVVLSVPELTNNQVLVYMSPDSSRVRVEPTPKFIVLETWTLVCTPYRPNEQVNTNADIALPIIYKHGIVLFRSIFSLLRILPAWKFYKRLRRKTGGVNRNGNLGIQLRVRPLHPGGDGTRILEFGTAPSPTHRQPLSTSTHTFPPIPHILGNIALSTTYLDTPNFQLDELESLLSSRFISLDLEGFVPTLDKNRQRDSITGSSLPNSSGIRSVLSRSPPRPISRATSATPGATGIDSASVAERFILPSRGVTPFLGTSAMTGTSALIPPPRPFPSTNTTPTAAANPSGLAINRFRKESLNSSASSSVSNFNPGTSSLSSSPSTGPLAIRRPNINPVHPFKSNTLSSGTSSSPSLSLRQGGVTSGLVSSGSPVTVPLTSAGSTHSRQASSASPVPRLPPSPIGTGFSAKMSPPAFSPSSLGDRRPGTSGSVASSSERDRKVSLGGDAEGPAPMAMPQRKRYSSSFGHRYAGSTGSSSTGLAVGSAASGGGLGSGGLPVTGELDTPGSGSGRNTPASVMEGRKEGLASYLSTTTDDDDISIFVQQLDSRKPLSGRVKERENRDREWDEGHGEGQGHDRETTDTTVKGKQKETISEHRRAATDRPFTTPPTTLSSVAPSAAEPLTQPLDSATASSAAAQTSTSPSRGPMLTSQSEVDERLSKMTETFLKSLEGLGGGSTRRKDKERIPSTSSLSKTSSSATVTPGNAASVATTRQSSMNSVSTSVSASASASASTSSGSGSSSDAGGGRPQRGMGLGPGLGVGFPSTRAREPSGSGGLPYGYSYNTPGLGLGLGRGRHASTSSSTLGTSEAAASQGSEEVIGRMELYEERRRSGYQG